MARPWRRGYKLVYGFFPYAAAKTRLCVQQLSSTMNFLSSAFSTLTGGSIPYTLKEKVVDGGLAGYPDSRLVWTVYNGVNPKTDNSPVSVFEFSLKEPSNVQRDYVSLARNAYKKLKLIKFPGVVSVIDFIENDNFLYIVTERVTPLVHYLKQNSGAVSQDAKLFGIYSVGHALLFINSKANCLHGSLDVASSVFVNLLGEWKLFGFELLTNLASDPDQPIYRLSGRLTAFKDYVPEEVASLGVESIRQFPVKFDSFRFGVFMYIVLLVDFTSLYKAPVVELSQLLLASAKVPRQINTAYKRLVSAKSSLRTTVEKFLQDTDSYFSTNNLVQFSNQLEEIKFKNEAEKLDFFKHELGRYVNDDGAEPIVFPPGFLDHKLLPELVQQFNNLSNMKISPDSPPEARQQQQETKSLILNYILKFGSSLPEENFTKVIKPIIFQSFTLSDRSIRLILLTHLPLYAPLLTDSDVQLKIFNNIITGFQDTNFMIRETTLTSITTIIEKVSVKQVNHELLKVLAKAQMDPKPSIRTNTLILIIKISSKIYSSSRNSVLITALSKSLRDTFTPCKMKALSGFETLIEGFSLDEICGKILGHLAVSLMDPKSYKVRNEARRIFDLYLQSVERHAATLPQNEDQEDEEEKKFFQEYTSSATVPEKQESTEEGGFNFGWNMVNKLVSSSDVGGELNHDFNSSTPDLTRTATPTAQPAPVKKVTRSNAPDNSWADDLVDDNDNDGWDMDDGVFEPAPPPKIEKLKLSAPKVAPQKTPATARKSSSLKLGGKKPARAPGATLKLNLDIEEDEDGWGGSDNW